MRRRASRGDEGAGGTCSASLMSDGTPSFGLAVGERGGFMAGRRARVLGAVNIVAPGKPLSKVDRWYFDETMHQRCRDQCDNNPGQDDEP
jgi:hypothetical protein